MPYEKTCADCGMQFPSDHPPELNTVFCYPCWRDFVIRTKPVRYDSLIWRYSPVEYLRKFVEDTYMIREKMRERYQ